jgi:IclR family KDG regulon transcriptional repressor
MSTLANATSVLRLFSADRLELSVMEVSRLLAMPKSSTSRLLKSMAQEGLLAVAGAPPRYRVGHFLFEIAQLHRNSSSLAPLADQALREMCRETGHTGYISLRDGTDVLVIRLHPGSHALRVVTPLGSRAPAFATANGRALLARLDDEAVRALHPVALKPPSPNSPRNMTDLLTRLDELRRRGWCEAVDEAIPGVGSIAVSVADPQSHETLAFCLSYSASQVTRAEKRRMVSLLTTAARQIAAKLDDPFWRSLKPRVIAGAEAA